MGSPGEEVGKVATSAIDAMRSNPACLAALILAAMFVGLIYFHTQREGDRRAHLFDEVMERCFPTPGGGIR